MSVEQMKVKCIAKCGDHFECMHKGEHTRMMSCALSECQFAEGEDVRCLPLDEEEKGNR